MTSRSAVNVLVANLLVAWIVTASITPNNVSAQDQASNPVNEASKIRLARFDVDATPTVGSMMAYDRVKRVEEMTLRARGIVLLGADDPIVLCAVDWIGIGNEGHDQFRGRLAEAAGTTPDRVAVHTLHQHDAPRCDFTAERLVNEAGKSDLGPYDSSLAREVLNRLADAVKEGINGATEVTHAGWGTAEVKDVASNRRLQDETGRVIATRYTACRDPKLIAAPDGTIDPELTSLTFYSGDKVLAVLTHYACHPQSYYRTGVPSPDFPGLARFIRGQARPDVLHVHFNGAGGNIGAGKYNDGSPANRMRLAHRVADAMEQAASNSTKFAITSDDIRWAYTPVSLPPAPHLDADALREKLADWNTTDYWGSPDDLAWLLRCQNGHQVELSCLSIADVRLLHMPGELFVEYQLAAKAMRPDLKISMAAYGDYGPGYIGTEEAYGQGGYETSQRASKVGPEVEAVLMDGVRELLEVEAAEATVEIKTESPSEVESR
ncbi:hypothetical protein-signal peptide and transmembrane prediction [Rhodopirellula baltica SH 1]|uniref:Neutral/alkaline non-lysosomal ceramidase N-terminal domain-containing protein n=1 Tax=Rhodopirellula baltica (strain DSM 10527 / NCIMB 13988 / SH1) TaxID=243090 RepID=Q7UUF6_RHOBA|nr:hypothetical protein [Rhodopirellula baltica]CAD73124.1 hypothetical protein-signal peptide and transmembrane prediction [Rhodopirellula baltica SH 1]